MASQQTQRVRKLASPSTKQGPMKATLKFGLLQTSPTSMKASNRKTSPSSSPTQQWTTENHRKTRRSPDHRLSPDRGSPISPGFKVEKTKRVRNSPYEALAPSYLKGEWPRDPTLAPFHQSALVSCFCIPTTSEKFTQTEADDYEERRRKTSSHKRSSSLGNGDPIKERHVIKARLSKTSKESSSKSCYQARTSPLPGHPRTSPLPGYQAHTSPLPGYQAHTSPLPGYQRSSPAATTSTQTKAVNIPHVPKPAKIRGSVEGLNQEIEKLVLKTHTAGLEQELHTKNTQDSAPDGHRAPVSELLMRNADTQTPSAFIHDKLSTLQIDESSPTLDVSSQSSGSRTSSSQSSTSPGVTCCPGNGVFPATMDTSTPPASNTSEVDGPKECDSPNPREFLCRREPGDGCEKPKLIMEDAKRVPPLKEALLFCPIKKPKVHIPSEESAFCPLFKPYVLQPTVQKLSSAQESASPPNVIETH